MTGILYELQGVPLIDNRWQQQSAKQHTWRDGVWELLNGTEMLPVLPGQKVTEFEYPGQEGESQVQYAPGRGRVTPIRVRFYAIESDPQSPDFQRMPDEHQVGERLRLIQDNVDQFLFRTMQARSASEGYVRLSRQLGADGVAQHCVGRVTASSEPEYGPAYQWADYTFVFSNPSGTWFTDWHYLAANELTAGQTTAVQVPMGTAAVLDAMVAIRSTNGSGIEAGTRVVNNTGVGFMWGRNLNPGHHWRVVDCGRRGYGGHTSNTGDNPDWDVELDNPTMIHSVGRPQGGFLRITPGIPGSPSRAGLVYVTPTVGMDFRIAIRPRYY